MLKEIVITGVVGLGLVGGVGSVVQNEDGSSTVTIEDHGKKSSVTIEGNGRTYSCPSDVESQLEKLTILLGREKLTSERIERKLRKIKRTHPSNTAPDSVVSKYNALVKQDRKISRHYNKTVDQYNAVLKAECSTG